MNDLHIPASVLKREFKIWLVLLATAFASNVYAIVTYGGQWHELATQIHVVLILSVVFYAFSWLLRGLSRGLKALIVRR